jgi:hypothetical protein
MSQSLAPADVDESEHALATAFAPSSRGQFVDAWYRRVREVDDATMENLMRLLLRVRRIKHGLAAFAFVGGGMLFGLVPTDNPIYAFLIYATLACMLGMPTLATGTLAVRRIFLKEARRLGLSKSTAMLLLTRAERRARFQRPFVPADDRVEQLVEAVRDWDEA